MYAVLHLPGFPLQAVLRTDPDLWAQPVALVDPKARSTPVVIERTPRARDEGVEPGQTATQAMARCAGVLVRHRDPTREAAATDVLLQCAYGFSPHLEATAPGLCTMDLRGLGRLQPPEPDTLRAWAGELRAILIAQGLRPRIGIGATPNLARLAALFEIGRAHV